MQLNLNIIPRLPYHPENFVLHDGAKEAFNSYLQTISGTSYSCMWLSAGKREGKTHLSLRMVKEALDLKKYPKLIEGKNFGQYISSEFSKEELLKDQVFIVDDAESFFETIMPGGSGSFVNFIETLRFANAHIVFLSLNQIEDFVCDDHIKSRLKAGCINRLFAPGDSDIEALVFQMALQRGLSLKQNRIHYISKRVRRDIPYIETYLNRASHLSSVLSRSLTRPILANAL